MINFIKLCLTILYLTSFTSCISNKKNVNAEIEMTSLQAKDFRRKEIHGKGLHKCAFDQDLECAFFLGGCYLRHENDIEEALFWYNLASIKGNYSASLILGDLYIDGEYIEKNIKLARNYYYKSAVNGYGITIYVNFLKKYFPQDLKEINLWENIIYRINNIKLDDIEEALIDNYVKNNVKPSLGKDEKKVSLLLDLIKSSLKSKYKNKRIRCKIQSRRS